MAAVSLRADIYKSSSMYVTGPLGGYDPYLVVDYGWPPSKTMLIVVTSD